MKPKPYASKQAKLTGRKKINNKGNNSSNIDLMPILIGELKAHPNEANWKKVQILVDSGASASIIHEKFVSDLPKQKAKGVTWSTMGGQFKTVETCETKLCLPELNATALINVNLHITNQDSKYDIILGRDVCGQLGIVIDFEKGLIKWNEAQARMKYSNLRDGKVIYHIDDSRQVQLATKRVKKILDAKYEKANLVEVTKNVLTCQKMTAGHS